MIFDASDTSLSGTFSGVNGSYSDKTPTSRLTNG